MTILNKRCYFTIYGNWFDDPYDCKYLVDKYILKDDNLYIYLENGRFQITINGYKNLRIKLRSISIEEANRIIINWLAFNDQKYINECMVSYSKIDNQIIKERIIMNSSPHIEKIRVKDSFAFKIFL